MMKNLQIICLAICLPFLLLAQEYNSFDLSQRGIPGNRIVDLEALNGDRFFVATNTALALYSGAQFEVFENIETSYLEIDGNNRTVKTRMMSRIPPVKKIYVLNLDVQIFLLENGQLLARNRNEFYTTPEYTDGTLLYEVDFLWDRERPFVVGKINAANGTTEFFGELEDDPGEAADLNAFQSLAFSSDVVPQEMGTLLSMHHDTERKDVFLFDAERKGFLYYEYDYDIGNEAPKYYELKNDAIQLDQIKWMTSNGRVRFPSGYTPSGTGGYLYVADNANQVWRYLIYNGNQPFDGFAFESNGTLSDTRFGKWDSFTTFFETDDLPKLFPLVTNTNGYVAWTAAEGTDHLYSIDNLNLTSCRVDLSATPLHNKPISGMYESYYALTRRLSQLWLTTGMEVVQFLDTQDLSCDLSTSTKNYTSSKDWQVWFDGSDIQVKFSEATDPEKIDLYHTNGELVQTVEVGKSRTMSWTPSTKSTGLYWVQLHKANGSVETQKLLLY